jgi:phosphatidylserine/phosphatidylglycerophosphate/cardiolipin synthase-like enzyme
MKKRILTILIGLVLYILAGAILPFIHQPDVSQEQKNSISVSEFYGNGSSQERAYILSDNGEALTERIRMISKAKERIILSTFEFRSDESGKMILSALARAAERGVKVQLLIDGMTGFIRMKGNEYFYALSSMENVEIRIYNPISLIRPWSMMGRLHDKYLIADKNLYILGGRNTYDYFLGSQPGYKNYDWDVLVYQEDGQGESMKQLLAYFDAVWNQPECKKFNDYGRLLKKASVRKAAEELKTIYDNMKNKYPQWFEYENYNKKTKPTKQIKLISNPTTCYAKEPVVFYTITQLMQNAKEEVTFHTPYIICNKWMLEEIKKVCENVPKVTMMTNSIANNGNPFGAMDYKNEKGKLLETGMQILEYDGGVSYHGKCFIIDQNISAIGSFNWDMRSTYLDTELMLIIDSDEVNGDLREAMKAYEDKSLIVVGKENSIVPDGMTKQKISPKRKNRMAVLNLLGKCFRFLM